MREPNLVHPPQLNFEAQVRSSRRAGIIGDVAIFWHRGDCICTRKPVQHVAFIAFGRWRSFGNARKARTIVSVSRELLLDINKTHNGR